MGAEKEACWSCNARAPHGPLHHSLAPCLCLLLPLPAPELPLPLQLLVVSAEQPAPQQGNGALRTGPGGSHWHTGRPFSKLPLKPLNMDNFRLQTLFGKGSKRYLNFSFCQVINFENDGGSTVHVHAYLYSHACTLFLLWCRAAPCLPRHPP